MTAGLLAKTALFPLHLWLPPAHAGAPAPASTVLSALVVKGSFFVLVRLWFDVGPGQRRGAQLLAFLGAGAIFFGNVLALRQARLKLLIAYSTVAQIGYLFLMFPLAFGAASTAADGATALSGGLMQVISHATAKAAMFMSAGLDLRRARPRPHRRAGGGRPPDADEHHRVRAGRHLARRPAALRRLPREMAAALGVGLDRPVVVGGGDDRRAACSPRATWCWW